MRKVDLLSKEWCNLVFENRNKSYGAYRLRENAGKRYRFALMVIFGFFLFWAVLIAAAQLYLYYQIKEGLKDMERFSEVKMKPVEEGHVLKAVATGRHLMRTAVLRAPYATMQTPEIVDFAPNPYLMGEKGLEDLSDNSTLKIITLRDTTGLENDKKAPIIGEQLTPTEVVEQMPQFPGGPAVFMQWLDQNVIYPKQCVDAKIAGIVEVTFLVAPDGSVREPAVSKHLHPLLDKSALMAIQRMPRWTPGRFKGQPVLVRVTVPIVFTPQDQ